MVDINWDEAPEGTSVAVTKREAIEAYGQWRKFEGALVFYYKGGEWVLRSTNIVLWKRMNEYVERPPIVEAELPNGLVWVGDYTHWQPACGTFFFKEEGYLLGGKELDFIAGGFNYWRGHEKTISRFPGAKPKAPVEAPVKKRPVGWWN